jgi:hypothetical protein
VRIATACSGGTKIDAYAVARGGVCLRRRRPVPHLSLVRGRRRGPPGVVAVAPPNTRPMRSRATRIFARPTGPALQSP